MDSPLLQPSDPSLLLLDEIEILLAQPRLVALYLRQGHATAEAGVTQVLERFQTGRLLSAQGEQLRQRFHCELDELDARLGEKERELQALRAIAAEVEKHLSARITERELQLAQKHLLLEGRDSDIAWLKAGVSDLLEEFGRLESAARDAEAKWRAGENRIGDENQTEHTSLRDAMIQKRCALAEQAARAHNVKQSLVAQIDALQRQCAVQQQLLQKREHTLERVKFEVAALEARLAQREAAMLAEKQAEVQEVTLDRQTS